MDWHGHAHAGAIIFASLIKTFRDEKNYRRTDNCSTERPVHVAKQHRSSTSLEMLHALRQRKNFTSAFAERMFRVSETPTGQGFQRDGISWSNNEFKFENSVRFLF
jgi:hypothetical protein